MDSWQVQKSAQRREKFNLVANVTNWRGSSQAAFVLIWRRFLALPVMAGGKDFLVAF
jgi:hypothetical protein